MLPTDPSNDSFGNQRRGIGFAEIFDLTNYYRLTVYISRYYHRERSQNSRWKLFEDSSYSILAVKLSSLIVAEDS